MGTNERRIERPRTHWLDEIHKEKERKKERIYKRLGFQHPTVMKYENWKTKGNGKTPRRGRDFS
jgi:hypothetical protein